MNNTASSRVVPNLSLINVGRNAQPTLVDLDGDGILDVLVNAANATGANWNYYASRNQYQAGTFAMFNSATSLAFSDIDGDGDADAVGVSANGGLLYFRNDGRGQFTAVTGDANPFKNLSVGAGSQLSFVNGSLVATNANGTMQQFSSQNVAVWGTQRVWTWLGWRTITTVTSYVKQWQAGGSFDLSGINLGANARPTFVDFDGDGDLDIVVGGADGKIRYYESFRGKFYQQAEKYNPFQKINRSNRSNASPTIVDIDGNGTLDLIIGKSDGTIEQHRDMTAQFYRPVAKIPKFQLIQGTTAFSYASSWTSFDRFPRKLGDVNGDGRADIVGFGEAGVYVALGQGDGTFGTAQLVLRAFGSLAGGWTSFGRFPRELADVNGDGRADIIGFGETWVSVALGQTNGTFSAPQAVMSAFTPLGGGWSNFDRFPRQVADVNGDGRADIVGFGESWVTVALGQSNGTFSAPQLALNAFTPLAGQWTSFDRFPRQLADVNGDGRADIVGFGEPGVYVALGQSNGTFSAPNLVLRGFTQLTGRWMSFDRFPRQMGDVNGDGRADIVGFGESGVFVALGQLDGTFMIPHQYNSINEFASKAGGWNSFNQYPRQVADVNGDGLADVVGFGWGSTLVGLNKTPQIPKNADLLFELDFNTSGQGIFGNEKSRYSYSGGIKPIEWDYKKEYSFGEFAGINFGGIKAGTDGKFGVSYGYDLDLGSLNATLPVQTWFDLPDDIRAGQAITLKSGYKLKETASFSTTAPQLQAYFDFLCELYLGASIKVLGREMVPVPYQPIDINESFSLKVDSTKSWSGNMDDNHETKTKYFSGSYTQPGLANITIAGPKDGTQGVVANDTSLSGSSNNTILKANIDLDRLLGKILDKSSDPYLKAVAKFLEYIEGSASGSFANITGKAEWNLFDVEFANDLAIRSNINLSANNLVGTLFLEDGTRQAFQVGQDLTFNVGSDVNGDGFINMNAVVDLNASVSNTTSLTYQGAIEMQALSAKGTVKTDWGALGSTSDSFGFGPLWKDRFNLPGLSAETNLYNKTFALGGLSSQSFSFAVALNNRA